MLTGVSHDESERLFSGLVSTFAARSSVAAICRRPGELSGDAGFHLIPSVFAAQPAISDFSVQARQRRSQIH